MHASVWRHFAPIILVAVLAGSLAAGATAQTGDDLSSLNRQVEALLKAGKHPEALPLAQKAVAAAEVRHGPDHPETGKALTALAGLLLQAKRRGEAEPLLKRSLAIAEKAHGSDDGGVVGPLLIQLGQIHIAERRYADAAPLFERGLGILERELGRESPNLLPSLALLAELYLSLGRYGDAERFRERGLAIAEKAHGPEHPEVGTALADLGSLYRIQGRYTAAEPLLKRSLAIAEKAHGPDHADLSRLLNELALLYYAQGRYAAAEPPMKRGLAIAEKELGTEHPVVGTALSNLAGVYLALGRPQDAEPLLKRSLAVIEKALGPNDLHVAGPLNMLGALYHSQDRHAEAAPLLERSLATIEKARGPDHADVGTALNNLAVLYESQGRSADAEPLLKRSIAIAEKVHGPDHPEVGMLLHNLAGLQRALGRYADAEPLYRRSLAIMEKGLGKDHPTVSHAIGSLGAFLKSEGRLAEAGPLLKRALDAALRAFGPEHPQVIRATINLAELYGLQGRVAEARALFAKAGVTKAVDLKTFPVYFATNRKRDPKQKRIALGRERSLGTLTLGIVKVVIPPAPSSQRGAGATEGADLRLSSVRRLAIEPAELASAEKLVRTARERLIGARAYLGQALIFVHGYNTSFDNAIRRVGQLAYDLNFDGPVFAFSWPSREKLLSYVGDRDSAQLSADALREFIEKVVAETQAKRIHIIAHSMGGVALNEALFTLEPETLAKLNLGEMVLASPDLDPDLFQRTYKRLQKRGATATIYAASSDWALWVSSGLRARPQLGYIPAGGPTRLVEGTDLIDITAVNADVLSLNHDIYAHSPAVIGDLRRLLKQGQRPPDARTPALLKVPAAGGVFWRYKGP